MKKYTLNINVHIMPHNRTASHMSVQVWFEWNWVIMYSRSQLVWGFCARNIMLIDLIFAQFQHYNPSILLVFYESQWFSVPLYIMAFVFKKSTNQFSKLTKAFSIGVIEFKHLLMVVTNIFCVNMSNSITSKNCAFGLTI